MKVVLQRVTHASVCVDKKIVGEIQQGLLILVGFQDGDDASKIEKVARKCVELRIFEDELGKMNRSLLDVGGSILSISQFTLYADCKKGRRPSFTQAAKAENAIMLYDTFNSTIKSFGVDVKCGIFGADMKVSLLNDGPVTIIIDSEEI